MSQLRSGREIAGDLTGQDLPVALGSPRRFETNVEPRRRLGSARLHATWPTGGTAPVPLLRVL